ncbi:sushi, von Willebrand factor type A, EGF and pentraxin domain-containing protein 1-like [Zootermopsis nevadensis]|uniref:sushi, von Willebrand factor type A, EGF and pentraxin domain-containing protein 1-like n=1 Tax=Zootermopsis nevadensis TaxID=136037 RepID=UPI000B8EB7AC|nr:sushi, von Willebrand factor type A, EGF and pentraxin domain-containing protein 1-like [Zootermopsis nevadensis]
MSPTLSMLMILLACLGAFAYAADLSKKCPDVDPWNYTVLLPDTTDCSKYFSCHSGTPIQLPCPPGLHFNDNLKVCDYPRNANCVPRCSALVDDEGGHWTPESCSSGFNDQGATCSVVCNKDYELKGSAFVQCTENGWNSSNGNFIPRCLPVDCIAEDLEDELNKTLSVNAGLLFVLDESGSVSLADFIKTKEFVKDIVTQFPLSANRSAGVITFDSSSVVRINLNENSTTQFLSKVDKIGYRGGGTNILDALRRAIIEINTNAVHNLTLVFLITDGVSTTDGTPAANEIKSKNNALFTIGVSQSKLLHLESLASTGDNGIKHFFHIRSYDILQSIGKYLNPPAGSGGSTGSKCKSK